MRIRFIVDDCCASLIGNKLWADSMNIPDPACAALELGRRCLHPLTFTPDTRTSPPKPNDGRQRKDGRRAAERSAALGGWGRVWRHLNPTERYAAPGPEALAWTSPLRATTPAL